MRAVGGPEPGSSSGNPVGGGGAGIAGLGQNMREMPVTSPGQSPSSCGNPGSGTSCLYHLESFWASVVLPVKWAMIVLPYSQTNQKPERGSYPLRRSVSQRLKTSDICYMVSEGGKFSGDLAGCFWLRTSSEVSAKMLARLQSSEGMTRRMCF